MWESEDAEGKRGVRLSKDIVKVAGRTRAVASGIRKGGGYG